MKVHLPVSEEMMAFLDMHASELQELLGARVTRTSIVRECVSRIAWDYFGEDIE